MKQSDLIWGFVVLFSLNFIGFVFSRVEPLNIWDRRCAHFLFETFLRENSKLRPSQRRFLEAALFLWRGRSRLPAPMCWMCALPESGRVSLVSCLVINAPRVFRGSVRSNDFISSGLALVNYNEQQQHV